MSDRRLPLGDMQPAEFADWGHRAVDWIAEYLRTGAERPVLSRLAPGDLLRQLPEAAPRHGRDFADIWQDFERLVLPGITHWNHPRFFGYFAITASAPGIIAELLCAALNVNAMLWKTSPAATELEQRVLAWLGKLLGLPPDFDGVIVDTASIATLLALTAARERTGLEIRARGMAGRTDLPRLRVYASAEAHSSVDKAAIVIGLGQEGLVRLPSDEQFRMDVAALEQAIQADVRAGVRPLAVVATVGTTSTTSVDPIPEIAALCERHGAWLHVDAAYAGLAAAVPERRSVLAGVERADSLVVNPHKWLFTPLDCSVLYVREPDTLRQAFSLVPEYLKTSDEGVVNYMDWGVQLGRRFRALKLWMVLSYFGEEGIAARLRSQMDWAHELAGRIDRHPDFERLSPTPFSTLCFRYRPGCGHTGPITAHDSSDEPRLARLNQQLLERVNDSGRAFLSHTRVHDRFALRLAIGNLRTTFADVMATWELLCQCAHEVAKSTER